jgi:hypothetical protein
MATRAGVVLMRKPISKTASSRPMIKPGSKGWAPPPSEWTHVRWIALVLSICLMAGAVLLRINPSLLPRSSALISELLGKVGIVVFCLWLAWPAIVAMLRLPSGVALGVASLFAFGLFLYRSKTIYITGPFLIIAAAVAFAMSWIRRR